MTSDTEPPSKRLIPFGMTVLLWITLQAVTVGTLADDYHGWELLAIGAAFAVLYALVSFVGSFLFRLLLDRPFSARALAVVACFYFAAMGMVIYQKEIALTRLNPALTDMGPLGTLCHLCNKPATHYEEYNSTTVSTRYSAGESTAFAYPAVEKRIPLCAYHANTPRIVSGDAGGSVGDNILHKLSVQALPVSSRPLWWKVYHQVSGFELAWWKVCLGAWCLALCGMVLSSGTGERACFPWLQLLYGLLIVAIWPRCWVHEAFNAVLVPLTLVVVLVRWVSHGARGSGEQPVGPTN